MDFYAGLLGFQPGMLSKSWRMGDVGLDALQPHVVAFNTWKGAGLSPAPADALGMRYFTVVLPDAGELERMAGRLRVAGLPLEPSPPGAPPGLLVRDPSGIPVLLTGQMLPLR